MKILYFCCSLALALLAAPVVSNEESKAIDSSLIGSIRGAINNAYTAVDNFVLVGESEDEDAEKGGDKGDEGGKDKGDKDKGGKEKKSEEKKDKGDKKDDKKKDKKDKNDKKKDKDDKKKDRDDEKKDKDKKKRKDDKNDDDDKKGKSDKDDDDDNKKKKKRKRKKRKRDDDDDRKKRKKRSSDCRDGLKRDGLCGRNRSSRNDDLCDELDDICLDKKVKKEDRQMCKEFGYCDLKGEDEEEEYVFLDGDFETF